MTVRRGLRGMALVAGIAAAVIAAGTPFAHASTTAAEDGADTFNVAKGTAVTATSTKIVFSVPQASLTITCTASSLSGKTGAGLTIGIGPGTFNDGIKPCNDTLGFSDSFKSNTTNGAWMLIERDFTNSGSGDEGMPEPNATGDRLVIRIPKAGLVDTNNWPCTLTFAPTAAVSVSGTYNDAGTFTIKGAKTPVSVSGPVFCGPASQTATITATYKVSPGIFDKG